ncbi:lipase family protein [Cyclobacterium xiamenense]|uniref:lipase family protein n=1 Tax=Cyclobacterium xiamenense TaxID=1297121 RepID=UPI0035CEEF67
MGRGLLYPWDNDCFVVSWTGTNDCIVLTRLLFLFCLLSTTAYTQVLQPHFDKEEYVELLKINKKTHLPLEKWATDSLVTMPEKYAFSYRSPELAFDNRWDLWFHKTQPIAVLSVRGSIATEASWLANFYAAMIPAKGEIEWGKTTKFPYALAESPKAAVHVGWLLAMAHLTETIESKIDSSYQAGVKDFILTGHSQGGGITYLLTAYLRTLQKNNRLPADIQFKTYCSAGPKPGNLFFAYEYEKMTDGGWAFNVVNTADWVPDVPFSLQTINDFTEVNPFSQADQVVKKQKFPKNLVLKHLYNKLSKPSLKAQKNYQKYLGEKVSVAVKKQLPDIQLPEYYESNHYVRTGRTIVLVPDQAYWDRYPNTPSSTEVWTHHLIVPYLFLASRL